MVLVLRLPIVLGHLTYCKMISLPLAKIEAPGLWYSQSEKSGTTNSEAR